MVAKLNVDPDWRAGAFLLERRFRDRWGRHEHEPQKTNVLVVSEELAADILEALRVAGARHLPQETAPKILRKARHLESARVKHVVQPSLRRFGNLLQRCSNCVFPLVSGDTRPDRS